MVNQSSSILSWGDPYMTCCQITCPLHIVSDQSSSSHYFSYGGELWLLLLLMITLGMFRNLFKYNPNPMYNLGILLFQVHISLSWVCSSLVCLIFYIIFLLKNYVFVPLEFDLFPYIVILSCFVVSSLLEYVFL